MPTNILIGHCRSLHLLSSASAVLALPSVPVAIAGVTVVVDLFLWKVVMPSANNDCGLYMIFGSVPQT